MDQHLWKPNSQLNEPKSSDFNSGASTVSLVAHIFYIDFVDKLFDALESGAGSIFAKTIVTTPSKLIQERVYERARGTGLQVRVALYPNRGRNFGPLLCELSKGSIDTEYFVHVHSKKSPNRDTSISIDWAQRCWYLLVEDSKLLQRALLLMESDSNLATVSPLVSDLIPCDAFSWTGNEAGGLKIAQLLGLTETPSRFAFPAGGMFLARTKDLDSLGSVRWEIDWFPEELGQLDGTLQHAAERMVGLTPSLDGKSHGFFHNKLDMFTADESFVVADGHKIRIQNFADLQKNRASWIRLFWLWVKSLLGKP